MDYYDERDTGQMLGAALETQLPLIRRGAEQDCTVQPA